MAQHTPGPVVQGKVIGDPGRDSPKYLPTIVRMPDLSDVSYANARLIAAAPELLAALKMVVKHEGRLTGGDWKTIRSAIAKATGKPA